MLKVKVLGCGPSNGVPFIGCNCAVCTSDNPRNKRLRSSILLEAGGKKVLVDTSPDLRQQCLREGISTVDAIIFTHPHADHLHGIDETRCFNYLRNSPIDIYGDEHTLKHISDKFSYTVLPPKPAQSAADWGWTRPCLIPHEVTPLKPFEVQGLTVLPLEQQHGGGKSLGLRVGSFAYSTDVNGMSEETLKALEGIDTWIVDCLRPEPAPTHAHLEMTLEWIARIKPKRAYLTHMTHGFDYEELARSLPKGVEPSYDGLELSIA